MALEEKLFCICPYCDGRFDQKIPANVIRTWTSEPVSTEAVGDDTIMTPVDYLRFVGAILTNKSLKEYIKGCHVAAAVQEPPIRPVPIRLPTIVAAGYPMWLLRQVYDGAAWDILLPGERYA